MKTLIMTVGLPRSGKSTFAADNRNIPCVNADSIRLALHGQPFIGLAEPFVWAIAKTMVRSLFIAGHDVVILDATNITRKRRDEWKSSAWLRFFIELVRSEDDCIQQAYEDGYGEQHGLIDAIRRMAEEYEPLTSEEIDESVCASNHVGSLACAGKYQIGRII